MTDEHEKLPVPDGKADEGPPRSLAEIERLRRHLWFTVSLALVVVSTVVVVLSYRTDVFPDDLRSALGFAGWRFVFLVLTLGFVVYAIRREHILARLTSRLLRERERAASLETSMADLNELERVRSDLVATVTHEIKTPLTSLLGYAAILRKRGRTLTDEQRAEFLEVVERQGRRILRLIEELLQSSRLESAPKLQRIPLDLAGISLRVAKELTGGYQRHLELDMPDHDLGVFGDPAAMEHVVTNLVDNAIKYSPLHAPIRVGVYEGEGEVLLGISDEGAGIAPGDLPHIFERFHQAGNARGGASVGLGLYIVRNLVEAQGGRVWADSELGKGSTFTVALPRRRP